MSIGTVNGVGPAASPQSELRTGSGTNSAAASAAATARKSPAPAVENVDEVTQQPLPPRFPWLSRLSQQLEAASKQRAAFPPAPMLGDNLDKTA
ncbi:MAG TPA: hypothetical protein VJN68_10995 [Burkholderiaceae bacterium]|nr:hypothetical protein [Burkholderiaceae bacterium]